ncbi:MFS transporter [Streptomyces cyaneochromogenes]|uniref:hypothetical protein n=1 Tax=Streptomyces cyaneochromogenes TaxID=2496836 RepID=UPI001E31787E|nr:hypothetical protein [Streptomyces cyaneochromogenes]
MGGGARPGRHRLGVLPLGLRTGRPAQPGRQAGPGVRRLRPLQVHRKSIGYTLGPLLGGVLVWAGGLRLLFTVLAVLAAVVAVWGTLAVPAVAPLPKSRKTAPDLARRLASRTFLAPHCGLAGATAVLSAGVGFLPVSGAAAALGTVATGAAVSVLAATATIVQPYAGRALDSGRVTTPGGLAAGFAVTGAGPGRAILSGPTGILTGAALIGAGTG